MAIVVENSWVNQSVTDNGTDWSWSIPSTLTAGRLLVVGFNNLDGREEEIGLADDGTGTWTILENATGGGNDVNPCGYLAYKIAGGDETEITGTGDFGGNITLLECSGHAASPFDDSGSAGRADTSPITLTATATGAGAAVAVLFDGKYGGSVTDFSGFSGWTPDGTSVNTDYYSSEYSFKTHTSAGAVSASGTFTPGDLIGHIGLFLEATSSVPTLSTPTVSSIDQTTATLGCTVTY